MTQRMRIEARADYRADGKSYTKNALIYCVAPGESQIDWQTEKVRAVSDLQALIDAINKAKGITFLMEMHYASMLFPNHRAIDFLSLQFSEWKPAGGDGALLTPTCKDLTVSGVLPLTSHLVDLAKANGTPVPVEGADVDKTQVVTLRLANVLFTS
jgi:hypothetical protein